MNTAYQIIRIGSPTAKRQIDWPEQPGYDAIRNLVEPVLGDADVEHVVVLYRARPADMFVDEVGALCGLPVNTVATTI